MFWERFSELCKPNGVSANAVCATLRLSTATATHWKNGKYTPKQDKLQKIADYFGVTVDYLMGNDTTITEEDIKLNAIMQEIRDNPEMQALFELTRNATAEELKQYAEVIKALRGAYRD